MGKKSEIRGALKKLRAWYAEIDATMRAVEQIHPTECSVGTPGKCNHCCHQIVTCSIAEALLIVVGLEANLTHWGKESLLQKCKVLMHRLMKEDLTCAKWWDEQIPCVFLGTDGMCSIYQDRPSICRSHAVVKGSDCSIDNPQGRSKAINVGGITQKTLLLSKDVSDRFRLPLGHVPLPVAMIWAFTAFDIGVLALQCAIKGTLFESDLECAKFWIAKIHEGEVEESKGDA